MEPRSAAGVASGQAGDHAMTVTIERTEILSDGHYRLERVHLAQVRGDGTRQMLAREVLRQPDASAVLPHDPGRGMVLLVEQVRAPLLLAGLPGRLIEAAAGVLEGADTPEQAARKEAEQELGCRLHALRPIFALFTSPGASTERLHLFLAEYGEADRTGAGGGLRAEGEDIKVLELPLADAVAMTRRGEITDMKTVLLLHAALLDMGSGLSA